MYGSVEVLIFLIANFTWRPNLSAAILLSQDDEVIEVANS